MRIAFAAQPFDLLNPPVQGGSLAIWIYQIARICAMRGNDTIVFANHGPALRSKSLRNENIDYIYTPTGMNRLLNKLYSSAAGVVTSIDKTRPGLPSFASVWQDLVYAMEIGRRSAKLDCEVVHVMNYSQYIPIIRRLNPKCKICLHMQCEWLTQLDYAAMEKRLACTDLIIGCSQYITSKIAERFPQFEKKCVTVPNASPLTPETDRTTAEPFNVLFVGRISPEKGIHDLVRAFHLVLKRFPQARLHMVGGFGSAPYEYILGQSDDPHVLNLRIFYEQPFNGKKDPYAIWLEKEAGAELNQRIFFEGRVEYDQVENFYQRSTVLINPSLSESFGMSLVEAMMHNMPVVATRVGGMPYIVDHGRTGLLVEPANPEVLADAICKVLGEREIARQMGDAGRKKAVEQFSWERATDTLLEHFKRVIC